MRSIFSVISAALLAASAMAVNSCNDPVIGLPGLCISTSSCTSGGGTYRSGYCPNDPTNVKCCTYGTCNFQENGYTVWGGCIPTANCRQFGGTPRPGHCRGPSDIQCCPQ
ncbi:hypothetical protein DFQ26_008197 [Actinomortierella ambigua]|nr:hypothetical protein DFQ26_008197 [Actinomortierella ambigua]